MLAQLLARFGRLANKWGQRLMANIAHRID